MDFKKINLKKYQKRQTICNTRQNHFHEVVADANFDDFFKYKKKIEYAMTNRLNSKNIDRDKTFSK